MKFEIKSHLSGAVLFALETESLTLCVEAAVKSRADLRGADLMGADLRGADLMGAYLRGADLTGANLMGAYLRGADLRGVNLRDTNLTDTNLWGADLRGTYLRDTNLWGAYLRGADLTDTNLRGAVGINKHLCTPLRILLAQPGLIRAYKLVTANNVGPYNGGLIYKIGETVKVKDANTDESEQCAAGISLATLDWCMREWRNGYKILLAEFTVKDIAAIPTATDGKFRVHRCKIVGEVDLKEIGLVV